MPFNGSGVFNPLITFEPNTLATAQDQNTQDSDIASGLTNCMTRDGQGPATANISIGGFQINNVGSGTATTDAVNLGQLMTYMPPGVVVPYAGISAPTGWIFCYGQLVSRTTYANLFNAIGTTFGAGDGSTTFGLPELRGNVVAGVDNMGGTPAHNLTGYVLNTSGGSQSVALTTLELPAHNHGVTDPGHTHTVSDPGHSHSPTSGNGFVVDVTVGGSAYGTGPGEKIAESTTASATTGITNASNTTGITTNNTGSGESHLNVQATLALNYMIKT